ncbi:hypothetical membrane protein [Pelotomaculum thermopropionicum SI]|uniref:Hypothetical membrane protein n=1 Tax=Pelotomaculum thermopropionicum (strain DSM 13744 / JCM 10971 / SI) TaxID=370438 RepID=A5CYA9_PELTS|nr:hypothetical membrane protein [Pelotomaculum thermopropionicum SI]
MRKWIVPVAAGLLVLTAVGLWGYGQHQANRSLENFLNNKYRRAFYDMTGQVQSLEVLLSKSLVASDPHLDKALLMEIRQQAAFAQSNLGQLPLNDVLAGRTAKFLTQVANYAESLARQLDGGGAIDGGHWETLNNLYEQSAELNRELQGMQYRVAQNNFYFGELLRQVRKNLQKPEENPAQADLQALDRQMQRYPALIYDGPFSEHLERAEPRALSGQAEISQEEAINAALAFLDRRPGVDYQAVVTGIANGRIPAYRVEVAPAGGGSDRTVLDVTRQGGRIAWMLNSRPVGEPALDLDQAGQKALKFLSDRGFGEMHPTYFMKHGNAVTFNFAAVQDGVTVYPDLVKVTVGLDDGQVTGVEATGYLMSHRPRQLPAARISPEKARAAINPRLEVSGGRLVLIPAGVDNEKLAYEFQGKLGEDTYLIYVNALDGREENVLKLVETPGGTLTM